MEIWFLQNISNGIQITSFFIELQLLFRKTRMLQKRHCSDFVRKVLFHTKWAPFSWCAQLLCFRGKLKIQGSSVQAPLLCQKKVGIWKHSFCKSIWHHYHNYVAFESPSMPVWSQTSGTHLKNLICDHQFPYSVIKGS